MRNASSLAWHKALGFGDEAYRYHDHEKLAHYANAATDIEFRMPFGFKEVEGIHSRTNFDLGQHEKFSGKNIKYFDPETNESYTPYVIETSIGVDRMFLSIMCASYCEEKLENGETRVVLRLPAAYNCHVIYNVYFTCQLVQFDFDHTYHVRLWRNRRTVRCCRFCRKCIKYLCFIRNIG